MSGAPSQVTWSLAMQTFGPQEHQHHGGGCGWGAVRRADSQAHPDLLSPTQHLHGIPR